MVWLEPFLGFFFCFWGFCLGWLLDFGVELFFLANFCFDVAKPLFEIYQTLPVL